MTQHITTSQHSWPEKLLRYFVTRCHHLPVQLNRAMQRGLWIIKCNKSYLGLNSALYVHRKQLTIEAVWHLNLISRKVLISILISLQGCISWYIPRDVFLDTSQGMYFLINPQGCISWYIPRDVFPDTFPVMYFLIHPLGCICWYIPMDVFPDTSLGMYFLIHL